MAILLRATRFGIILSSGKRRMTPAGLPVINNHAAFQTILHDQGNSWATIYLNKAINAGVPRKKAYKKALDTLAKQLRTKQQYALPSAKNDIYKSFTILLDLASRNIPLAQAPLHLKIFSAHPL